MKLYYSSASPYVRKVLIHAIETKLLPQIEIVNLGQTGQFVVPENYKLLNPLLKVPTLTTLQGESIFDSRVICEYLDHISIDRKLIPQEPLDRITALKQQTLADGIMDAAVARRMESLKDHRHQSSEFDKAQKQKIENALEYFEKQNLKSTYQIGEVAFMSALAYLEFRFAHENWLNQYPKIKLWFSEAQKWPPFQESYL